jgi:hypothetical protein
MASIDPKDVPFCVGFAALIVGWLWLAGAWAKHLRHERARRNRRMP